MIPIARSSVLTSNEATREFQAVLTDFMIAFEIPSVEEVSEHFQVSHDWELTITCTYKDDSMVMHIPAEEWVPAANV